MHTIYDFDALRIDGSSVPLRQYEGKVLLIVNTASKCGFTPQFEGLETLWQSHGPKGLVILGFPCNQFGSQDPGNNSEIANFCQRNYGVSFPMMAKIDVNGPQAHPLYQHLTEAAEIEYKGAPVARLAKDRGEEALGMGPQREDRARIAAAALHQRVVNCNQRNQAKETPLHHFPQPDCARAK